MTQYAKKGRATLGIKTIDTNAIDIVGKIAAARVVQKSDDLTIISVNGVVIRTKVKNIKQAGRATRGVRLMNLGEGDSVASIARFAAADLKRAGVPEEESNNINKK